MSNCKKRVEGNQWVCNHCGTRWDLDDKEPPACKTNFIFATGDKEPFKAGVNDRRFIIIDDDAPAFLRKTTVNIAVEHAMRNIREVLKK